MIRSFGACSRHRTISTRCRIPTGRSPTIRSGSSGRPYSALTVRIRAASSRRGGAGSMPSAMFSATLIASKSEKCWNTIATPAARAETGPCGA